MRSINSGRLVVFLLIPLCVVAASFSAAHPQDKPMYKPTGGEAMLLGTISFEGAPPEPLRIDTSADSVCEKFDPLMTDWVIVKNHKLANVVVYVRGESLNLYSFETPSAGVTLEHKGCRYVPHVLGLQTQQTLWVLNSDATTHNTHPTPKNNREWNYSQPSGAAAITQRFEWSELFMQFKDNHHPWEKAYVGVFSRQFFSASTRVGTEKIRGRSTGNYAR